MSKRRTSYLSYIEETPKHFDKLQQVAEEATTAAVRTAKRRNLIVTYLKDDWIVRESSEGVITKVKTIKPLKEKQSLAKGSPFVKGRRMRVFAGPNGS